MILELIKDKKLDIKATLETKHFIELVAGVLKDYKNISLEKTNEKE